MPEGRSGSSPLLPVGVLPQPTAGGDTASRVGDSTLAAPCGPIERASSDGSAGPASASSISEAMRLAQAELTRLRRLIEERRALSSENILCAP